MHSNDSLELEITETTDELLERLFEKIKNYLESANGRSAEEQAEKLELYTTKILETVALTKGRVAAEIIFGLSLKGPLDIMLADIEKL